MLENKHLFCEGLACIWVVSVVVWEGYLQGQIKDWAH